MRKLSKRCAQMLPNTLTTVMLVTSSIAISALAADASGLKGPASPRFLEFPLVQLSEAADVSADDHGERGTLMTAGSWPKPRWETGSSGGSFAVLRIASQGAAIRFHFDAMRLTFGSRLFVYGLDASGRITNVFGPYEGTGPMGTGEFRSRVVPGVEVVLELQGPPAEEWPFRAGAIFRIDEDMLGSIRSHSKADLEEQAWQLRPRRGETAYGFYRGRRVAYEIIDGLAITEGDIVLGTHEELQSASPNAWKGGEREAFGRLNSSYDWPGGVIPYTTDPALDGDPRVINAINHWNAKLPNILVKRTNQPDYVTFRPADAGCQSSVGRVSGQQFIDLAIGCSEGNVKHEIGHAAGLYHEQNRWDRDRNVAIIFTNILPDKWDQFQQLADRTQAEDIGPYDYGSIMHYDEFAFTILGTPWQRGPLSFSGQTIIPLTPGVDIGQRRALSDNDVAGVRRVQCNYAVAPSLINIGAAGGRISVNVTTPPYCEWRSTGSAHVVVNGTARMGSGAVTLSVERNPGPARIESVTVAGRAVIVSQRAF